LRHMLIYIKHNGTSISSYKGFEFFQQSNGRSFLDVLNAAENTSQ